MTATSPEGSVETTTPEPVKAGRLPDWRVVLMIVVFVPLMLGLPYLWPRVIDPSVPAPRIERRDDVAAILGVAAAQRAAYAEVARHERNYRSGSTALGVAGGVGAATSWLLATGPGMAVGAAVMGGLVYGGQFVFYSGRTVAAYERGERALACIDGAATGLRSIVPARLAEDAARLEAVLAQAPVGLRPQLAQAADARDVVAAAWRAGEARAADVAAIDRYEAARTVDPAPIASALREDTRVLDEARRRLQTLKPAVAARWRRELNQLAGASSRVAQLRQRADDLAKAEVAALAARALYRAEHAAAEDTIAQATLLLEAAGPLAATAPATAAALARQREAVAALVREIGATIEAVHEAVAEEATKSNPSREALRQAIARLEAVSGPRLDDVAAPPSQPMPVPLAIVVAAPAVSPALSLPLAAPAPVEPLNPDDAPALIAAATERANQAVAAYGAGLAGALATVGTLERAAAVLVGTTAATAQARERLTSLATRIGPEVSALAQGTTAAATLVRSVDVTGTRTRVVTCLTAAQGGGAS